MSGPRRPDNERDRAGPLDVLVVGAGISGLATAFALVRSGHRVAVLEAAERIGGAIHTVGDGPWLFELGPNTVRETGPVRRLLADCGLAGERLVAASATRRRYLWKAGRLQPLPTGPGSFLASPLLSARAKLRLLAEPWVPTGDDPEETIADFVRRRLGREVLDVLVGPFVSGVHAGDPERLAVGWAAPALAALEREHGSLLRGALAHRGRRPGGLISFPAGLTTLPDRLAAAIGDVRTGEACREVRAAGDGENGFRIRTDTGSLAARRVVLAVPAAAAAAILEGASGGASRLLAEVPYAPVAVVSLGYRRDAVAHPLEGFGFLVPRGQGLRILGCLFPTSLFPGRAPQGHVLLSAFLGGRSDPQAAALPDDEALRLVRADLERVLGTAGEPIVARVKRWPRAIPQYEVGHGRFLARAREIEAALPGLHLGGDFLAGAAVPDCVRNAAALAGRMS